MVDVSSLSHQLKELKELLDEGLVNQAEYQEKRQEIMAKTISPSKKQGGSKTLFKGKIKNPFSTISTEYISSQGLIKDLLFINGKYHVYFLLGLGILCFFIAGIIYKFGIGNTLLFMLLITVFSLLGSLFYIKPILKLDNNPLYLKRFSVIVTATFLELGLYLLIGYKLTETLMKGGIASVVFGLGTLLVVTYILSLFYVSMASFNLDFVSSAKANWIYALIFTILIYAGAGVVMSMI